MKQVSMSVELRVCPHCGHGNLNYYHEGNGWDVYYCPKCFGIADFNGEIVRGAIGEAYPNRER